VFLTDDPLGGIAPTVLDFSGNANFLSISPLPQQSFFIGDGHTDAGVTQRFHVPDGAPRLFLGLVDGYDPSVLTISGDPRFYDGGAYVGEYSVSEIPEPSTIAIWSLLGLIGLGYGCRAKRKVA
jgi:hypothetical protein